MAEVTRRAVDMVMDRISCRIEAIEAAHERCGVPLDDVLCAIVRQTLAARESDSHQMCFWEKPKDQP